MRMLALPLASSLSSPRSLILPHNPSSTAVSGAFAERQKSISASKRCFGNWISLSFGDSFGGGSGFRQVYAQKRPGNNTNEDTDEMFNDLFDKYGKVVYSRGDKKAPSAEADDDAESLSFAVTLAKVADDVKAADIRVLFVKPLVYWTRFFIIVTAFSRPQIDAIGSRIRDIAEKQFRKVPTGDIKPNSWTLLDFGDVVVHIFLPEQRAFYNLEEFYGNATPIELPFNKQSPFRS